VKNRAYAIDYYKEFLKYRAGKGFFFKSMDNEELIPIIKTSKIQIGNIWAVIFFNIGDNKSEPTKKIEISGCFDKGKNQFWELSKELEYIRKYTGGASAIQLPFYYFGYPDDIELLLQNNSEAYKITYDLSIQVIECATNKILIDTIKTFDGVDSLQNRKLALIFLQGFYSCFYKLCYVVRHYKSSDGKTIIEPSKTSKFKFQDKECNLRRTLTAKSISLFGFSDFRNTELNDPISETKVDIENDFDTKKNIINALVSELTLYEETGQQLKTQEAFIGEIGEISSFNKNEFGVLEVDNNNIYFRPDKEITYKVLKDSDELIDGIK